ncbi:MAG TPA: glycoside hydrolase family 31 protein [Terriglobales bacterium]|nr:glycoside hydrolase family 31 protein [Terriglobales bacterium]
MPVRLWSASQVVPGNVSSVHQTAHGLKLTAGDIELQIDVLAPAVVRLRYSVVGDDPPEDPFAVLPNSFENPPVLKTSEASDSVAVDTGAMVIDISKSPLRIQFLDRTGKAISQDATNLPVVFSGQSFRVQKQMPEDEHYFGLGDKTGPLDRRGMAVSLWNTDAFGWQESTDPLYKSIPFFLAMRNGDAYGLFLDNTYRTSFDFGVNSRDQYSFSAEGGKLDYYFFYGPDPKQVIRDFTTLVGRTQLPPLFALGYQQCRYSYYPEARVREIASEFRKRNIPADVIYLDIDYQQNNRPFTIDRRRFPNFEGMIKDLLHEGFKTVAITDLHIAKLAGYKPYDEGLAQDFFVKNPDGSVYTGKVWPGDSVFPDFTRAAVRNWWGTLYRDFEEMGIRGYWNDMNEPSIFHDPDKTMPLDTVHYVEGRKTDHREIHNVFGMENARATFEGLLRLQPDIRPFVLTRAAFAGTQRYAATWTGDNSATWNHMRISIPQLLNLGISGFAFAGDDIGGFNGSPTPELLTRWMELGTFNPMFRNHAAKGTRNREPWVDGPQHEAIRKKYIETRYQLLPYIYTEMQKASLTGVPVMRPLFLEFPDQPELLPNQDEFMFGGSLLVAPKVWDFAQPYNVVLPKDDWYNFWTGQKVIAGASINVDPPLGVLPVYVRAGTILPEQPTVTHVEEVPNGPLELRVYPGNDCGGDLYTDDGNTLAYQGGDFARIQFSCTLDADSLEIKISPEQGTYHPWFHNLQFIIYGQDKHIHELRINGNTSANWTQKNGELVLQPVSWPGTSEVKAYYSTK